MKVGAHARLERARFAQESAGVARPRRQRFAVRLRGGEPARLLLRRGGGIEQRLPFVEQTGVGAADGGAEEGEDVVHAFVSQILRNRLQKRLVSVVEIAQQRALAAL